MQIAKSTQQVAITHLDHSIGRVEDWMTSNKLKLIQAKTKFMVFGTKPQIKKIIVNYITVCEDVIPVKNHFDVELKMGNYVDEIIRAGYFHWRQISFIKRYLTKSAIKKVLQCYSISTMGMLCYTTYRICFS